MDQVWTAMSAISTAVGAVVVVVAALYTRNQLTEARQSRNVTLLLTIHEKYHSVPMRIARRRLLNGEFGSPEEFDTLKLEEADQLLLSQMFDDLQLLGLLVDKKMIEFELVQAAFPATPPRIWRAIAPFVAKVRERHPSTLGFVYFESLVSKYSVVEHAGDEGVWWRKKPDAGGPQRQ